MFPFIDWSGISLTVHSGGCISLTKKQIHGVVRNKVKLEGDIALLKHSVSLIEQEPRSQPWSVTL